jgi:DNA-directed RNA polymerase specialized sigma24 family protein
VSLDEVAFLTQAMRHHQEQITELGRKRRDKVLALRAEKVTHREIAEAMGVTEQSVMKIVRGKG